MADQPASTKTRLVYSGSASVNGPVAFLPRLELGAGGQNGCNKAPANQGLSAIVCQQTNASRPPTRT